MNEHDEDRVFGALDERTWIEIGRGRCVAEMDSGMARPNANTGLITDPIFAGVTEPPTCTGEPGPWVTAGFVSECAFGDMIDPGDTIRADGDGGWEHSECVERDEEAPIGGMIRARSDYDGYEDGDIW